MSWLTAYFRSKHVHSNTSQPVLLSTQLVFVLSEFPLCFFSSFFSLFPLSSFLFFLFSLFSLFCINSPSSLFTSRLHYFCVNPSSKHSTFSLASFFPFLPQSSSSSNSSFHFFFPYSPISIAHLSGCVLFCCHTFTGEKLRGTARCPPNTPFKSEKKKDGTRPTFES